MKTNYKLRHVSWNEIEGVSKNILVSLKDIEIDTLVAVFRGGSVLSLILGANMDNVSTASIHVRRSLSNEVNSDFGSSVILGITNTEAIENKNVLITEDIIDSGKTLDTVVEELKKYHPKNIYIASLFNFNKDKYKDIYSGEHLDEYCWIVFPWEETL